MALQLVCSWKTLMQYAKALGDAKKSGDTEKIAEAEKNHNTYRELCLKADRMINGEIPEWGRR